MKPRAAKLPEHPKHPRSRPVQGESGANPPPLEQSQLITISTALVPLTSSELQGRKLRGCCAAMLSAVYSAPDVGHKYKVQFAEDMHEGGAVQPATGPTRPGIFINGVPPVMAADVQRDVGPGPPARGP
eukprot:355127-Chlamydomonas_euryale.AAC.14